MRRLLLQQLLELLQQMRLGMLFWELRKLGTLLEILLVQLVLVGLLELLPQSLFC